MNMGQVMRATGTAEFMNDPALKERLLNERPFLRPFAENVVIFRVKNCEAWFWTFADSGRESRLSGFAFNEVSSRPYLTITYVISLLNFSCQYFFIPSLDTLLVMRHVKENVAVALLIAAMIVVAFWGIELHLLALMVVIAVIAYLAFVPALWENRHRT
ncbi:MAG: hypothetical protein ACXV5K_12045 [Halobacteriota archaeon]